MPLVLTGDTKVDASDARFGELRVWVDANGNGVTDSGELKTLEQAGVTAISLRATAAIDHTVKLGSNAVLSTVTFTRVNGTTGTAGDISFGFRPGAAPVAASVLSNVVRRAIFDGIAFENPQRQAADSRSMLDALAWNIVERTDPANDAPVDQASLAMFAEFGGTAASSSATRSQTVSGSALSPLSIASALASLDAVNDGATVSDTVEDTAIARKLALLRQDMAGFGGRIGEGERDWRAGDGIKVTDYFV